MAPAVMIQKIAKIKRMAIRIMQLTIIQWEEASYFANQRRIAQTIQSRLDGVGEDTVELTIQLN